MSIISIAVKHLIAAGITGEALFLAIAEMEGEITPKRSTGAIRQERYRRNKASQSVTNVTSDAIPPNGSNGFPDPSLTSLSPHKEKTPKGVQKKNPQQEVILPDWLPLAEWEGFKEMRHKIKKPMTSHAERLAIGKLDKFRSKGHDPTEILNQSILSDYQDVYEPKGKNYEKPIGNNQPPKSKWATAAEQYIAKHSAQPRG